MKTPESMRKMDDALSAGPQPTADFEIYTHGLVYCSVCTSQDASKATETLNFRHPTGISHGWRIADEAFKDGTPNGCQCPEKPSHKHFLFVC